MSTLLVSMFVLQLLSVSLSLVILERTEKKR